MRGLTLVVCLAGCRFGVSPLVGGPTDAAVADLTTAGDDGPTGDLADPCGAAPQAPLGSLVAACVIGSPPTVDGDLAEWPPTLFDNSVRHATASNTFGSFSGNEMNNDTNTSALLAARWDTSFLYIAAIVTDDVRDVSDPTAYYQDDAFELYLDGLGDRNDPYEADDMQLVFTAGAAGQMYKFGVPPNPAAVAVPAGIVARTRDTGVSAGWTLEVAIPWSVLTVDTPFTGRSLGFDVQLDDSDGTQKRQMVWKNVAPVGCTCAGGAACLPYCAPKSFITLMLGAR